MHYTSIFNDRTLFLCESPASAKILVDYVKTQLHIRLNYRLLVDTDPYVYADGLPDYLTFLRYVAFTVGYATEHGYIRYDYVQEAMNDLILLGAGIHSRHWNEAFQQGVMEALASKAFEEQIEQLRAEFYAELDYEYDSEE